MSDGRTRTARSYEVVDLDKRIIEHLQQDGRRPFTQIATELGVSEAAVRARTNRLIEKGILQVVGVTDPLKLGFQQWAMIGVKCEAARLLEVAEEIAAFPETDYVVVTAGHLRHPRGVRRRGQRAAAPVPQREAAQDLGVRETETFVYLRLMKQSYQWGTR